MRRIVLVLGTVAAVLVPAASASAQAPVQNPILFVHGFAGSASNWDTMIDRLRAAGYPAALRAFSYNSAQSNVTIAQQVAQQANRLRADTGAAEVDIVAHSMGSLSSRYYLKNLGGTANVDDWVSLGGPNHGTSTALLCGFLVSCREMLPGSSFLNALNSGDETPGAFDETPGGVWYQTVWSPCDEIINPDRSVILQGAINSQTGCVGHLGLLTSQAVFDTVQSMVTEIAP
jgi:triacylglycerol lipase